MGALGVYLRPLGLVWGRAAIEAAQAGVAGLIGGGWTGFTACEVNERDPAGTRRTLPSYSALRSSGEPVLTERLGLIETPRPPVAGLDFSLPCIMGVITGGGASDKAGALIDGSAERFVCGTSKRAGR